jgi:hypothetical protein
MFKKAIMILLCGMCGVVLAQDGRLDWTNDPNDPVMQMFRESQRRAQEETNKKPVWDLQPPQRWGGSPIEGMFILYSKNDSRETVIFRNNKIQAANLNDGGLRFVEGDKRADFKFDGKGGVISSVEMVFGNRTYDEYLKIVNDTKIAYGSVLTIISENPYFAAGNNIGVIGVANAKFNIWGLDGWTIDIEYVTRTVPIAGEYSGVINIKEIKNIVLNGKRK